MTTRARHNAYGYHEHPWHRARLDLLCFLMENDDWLTDEERRAGWTLYGPSKPGKHFCPLWSLRADIYIRFIEDFISDTAHAIERLKEDYQRKVA